MLREFNGLGQVITEWQDVDGAVNGSTPKVQYAYSEMAGGANHSRLTTITYPTVTLTTGILGYVYASGVASAISRVSSLTWKGSSPTTPVIETISYLGLNTVAERDHPQTNVGLKLTYVKQAGQGNGEAGDQYAGLDRFNRIADQRWWRSGIDLDRNLYSYDRDSNRLYKNNLLNDNFDELYHADGPTAGYDSLNRLVEWQRGLLTDTNADLVPDTVTVSIRDQVFSMDAQGNFDTINTDGTPTNRAHNAQNEILLVGAAFLTYDNNGNLTTDELGQQLVFDAWNRLVRVKDSGGATIIAYELDAVGRRIEEVTASTRDLYYSMNWQVLEERVAGAAQVQNVWSIGYVDAMVLRDRDADNNGSLEERLYVQQDANWNVTSITSATGAVVERFAYDVYGSMAVLSPTWVTLGGSAFGWNIGHQGGRFEILTGFIHKRRRDYSPVLQTWVSMDLWFTSTNWYVGYGNNPVNAVDPFGLQINPAQTFPGDRYALSNQIQNDKLRNGVGKQDAVLPVAAVIAVGGILAGPAAWNFIARAAPAIVRTGPAIVAAASNPQCQQRVQQAVPRVQQVEPQVQQALTRTQRLAEVIRQLILLCHFHRTARRKHL